MTRLVKTWTDGKREIRTETVHTMKTSVTKR